MTQPLCNCEECFLFHVRKNYCSLDGKQHKGCFQNFMPINGGKYGTASED